MTLLCLLLGHLPAARVLDRARSEQERADWYNRAQRRVNNAEFWTVDPTHHCWRCGKHLPERTVSEAR